MTTISRNIYIPTDYVFRQFAQRMATNASLADDVFQYRLSCQACDCAYDAEPIPREPGQDVPPAERFAQVTERLQTHFRLCTHCKRWVCADFCWDPIHSRCETCVPTPPAMRLTHQPAQPESYFSSILGALCQTCGSLMPESCGDCCPTCRKPSS